MRFVRKMRQDNNVTGHTSTVYAENDTQLLLPIRLGADREENHTRQLRD